LGVSVVETFDERFRGNRPAARRARFDPGGFVDFVAEGGDFAATDAGDPTDIEVAPQCRPKRSDTSLCWSPLLSVRSTSAARKARAVSMQDLAAADSDPAVSARKNATTPSPA
jgi:hypothetical protein